MAEACRKAGLAEQFSAGNTRSPGRLTVTCTILNLTFGFIRQGQGNVRTAPDASAENQGKTRGTPAAND